MLYDNPGDQTEETEFQFCELEFPKKGQLAISVPQAIRNAYAEASRIREIAPNAFAVQIRRALEALCDDRKAKGRNLGEKLKDLSGRGEIPPVLSEMTDVLRLIGNIGAHGIDQTVHQLHVFALDDFFKAIVEYVYVAPARLREFKKSMGKMKKKQKLKASESNP